MEANYADAEVRIANEWTEADDIEYRVKLFWKLHYNIEFNFDPGWCCQMLDIYGMNQTAFMTIANELSYIKTRKTLKKTRRAAIDMFDRWMDKGHGKEFVSFFASLYDEGDLEVYQKNIEAAFICALPRPY